jgi:hypothetical protein
MSAVEVKKIKTEYRAVEFDGSEGSESFDDVNELFDWGTVRGHINALDEYSPYVAVPEKKPTYPGETRSVYVNHRDWIVVSSRGKVKVLTDDEFNEKFKEK